MRSIIEELYYGNISPSDRDIIKGGTYLHVLNLLIRNEDELLQTLTQAQQHVFHMVFAHHSDKTENIIPIYSYYSEKVI